MEASGAVEHACEQMRDVHGVATFAHSVCDVP